MDAGCRENSSTPVAQLLKARVGTHPRKASWTMSAIASPTPGIFAQGFATTLTPLFGIALSRSFRISLEVVRMIVQSSPADLSPGH